MVAQASNLRKFLHENCVFHQFTKVFSLKFFHYTVYNMEGWEREKEREREKEKRRRVRLTE